MISSLTFRLPSDRVHKVFPVKANPAKAFVKVEGSSNLAAMLVSWFLLRRRSAEKCLSYHASILSDQRPFLNDPCVSHGAILGERKRSHV